MLKQKFQTILNRKHDNRKQQQVLSRKLRIESNLRSQLRDLKKKMAQKDAAIKHLKTENLLLKQTSRWCEITHSEENCKKMQDVADGKAQLHDEFPELQDNQRSTITAILTNPAIIIGFHFEHMWFVDNQNVLCQGHVLSVKCCKRSNMPKVTTTYWKHDENQDEGHDVTMTVYEFLVDYVTDDLQIPENAI